MKPKNNFFVFNFSALKNRWITMLNIFLVAFYILIFGLDIRQNFISLVILIFILILINLMLIFSYRLKNKNYFNQIFKINFVSVPERKKEYIYIFIINLCFILINLFSGGFNFTGRIFFSNLFIFFIFLVFINLLIMADFKNKKYS